MPTFFVFNRDDICAPFSIQVYSGDNSWGANSSGQLGDGTTTSRSVPTLIDSETNYSEIIGGHTHNCGITTEGEVKCWGFNIFGQVGGGATVQQNSPTPIDAGSIYSLIAAGDSHTCGITTEGALKCWGLNVFGQLGDGYIPWLPQPILHINEP